MYAIELYFAQIDEEETASFDIMVNGLLAADGYSPNAAAERVGGISKVRYTLSTLGAQTITISLEKLKGKGKPFLNGFTVHLTELSIDA